MESNEKMMLVTDVISGNVEAILLYVKKVIAGEIDEVQSLDKVKLLRYAQEKGSDEATFLLSILSSDKTNITIEKDNNLTDKEVFPTSNQSKIHLDFSDDDCEVNTDNISVTETEKCMLEARDLYREYLDHRNEKDQEKAISLMEKAIDLDIENRLPISYKKEFLVILYEYYREKNSWKASNYLELGVTWKVHVLMYEKGNLLYKKGNIDAAIEMYTHAMKGDDIVRISACRALIQIILFEKGFFCKYETLLQQGIVDCLEYDNEDIYSILIFADYLFRVRNNKDRNIGWMFNKLGIAMSNMNKVIFSLYKKALDLSSKLPEESLERQLGKLAYEGMAKISTDYTKKMYYEQKALMFK